MYVPWSLVLLLGYTTNVAQGYSSGAPVARCDNMIPAHRRQGTAVLSQQLPSPYSFQLQKYTYSEGEQIRMRLVAPQNAYFRGLLVKVVTQLGEAVGTVVPPRGYKAITCGRNGNEALTHTEKSNKPEVIFIWTAPSTAYGPLTIRTTIVYNYDTFWVNEIQATINPDVSTLPQVSTTVRPPVIPLVPELTTTTPTTDKSPVLTTQSEVNLVENLTSIYNISNIQNASAVTGDNFLLHNGTNTNNLLGNIDEDAAKQVTNMTDYNGNNQTNFIQNIAASLMLSSISNLADDYYAFTNPVNNRTATNESMTETSDPSGSFISVLDADLPVKDEVSHTFHFNISDSKSVPGNNTHTSDDSDDKGGSNSTTVETFQKSLLVNETVEPSNFSTSEVYQHNMTTKTINVTSDKLNVLTSKNPDSEYGSTIPNFSFFSSTTVHSLPYLEQKTSNSRDKNASTPSDTHFSTNLSTTNSLTESSTAPISSSAFNPASFTLSADTSLSNSSSSSTQNTTQAEGSATEENVEALNKSQLDYISHENNITLKSLPSSHKLESMTKSTAYQHNYSTTGVTSAYKIESEGQNVPLANDSAEQSTRTDAEMTASSTKLPVLNFINRTTSNSDIQSAGKAHTITETINVNQTVSIEDVSNTESDHINYANTTIKDAISPFTKISTTTNAFDVISTKASATEFPNTTKATLGTSGNKTVTHVTTSLERSSDDAYKPQEVTTLSEALEENTITSTAAAVQSTSSFENQKTSTHFDDFLADADFWSTSSVASTDATTATTLPPIIVKTFGPKPSVGRNDAPRTTDVWLNMKPVPFTVKNLFNLLPTTRRVWLRVEPTRRPPIFMRPVFKAPPLPSTTTTTTQSTTRSTQPHVRITPPKEDLKIVAVQSRRAILPTVARTKSTTEHVSVSSSEASSTTDISVWHQHALSNAPSSVSSMARTSASEFVLVSSTAVYSPSYQSSMKQDALITGSFSKRPYRLSATTSTKSATQYVKRHTIRTFLTTDKFSWKQQTITTDSSTKTDTETANVMQTHPFPRAVGDNKVLSLIKTHPSLDVGGDTKVSTTIRQIPTPDAGSGTILKKYLSPASISASPIKKYLSLDSISDTKVKTAASSDIRTSSIGTSSSPDNISDTEASSFAKTYLSSHAISDNDILSSNRKHVQETSTHPNNNATEAFLTFDSVEKEEVQSESASISTTNSKPEVETGATEDSAFINPPSKTVAQISQSKTSSSKTVDSIKPFNSPSIKKVNFITDIDIPSPKAVDLIKQTQFKTFSTSTELSLAESYFKHVQSEVTAHSTRTSPPGQTKHQEHLAVKVTSPVFETTSSDDNRKTQTKITKQTRNFSLPSDKDDMLFQTEVFKFSSPLDTNNQQTTPKLTIASMTKTLTNVDESIQTELRNTTKAPKIKTETAINKIIQAKRTTGIKNRSTVFMGFKTPAVKTATDSTFPVSTSTNIIWKIPQIVKTSVSWKTYNGEKKPQTGRATDIRTEGKSSETDSIKFRISSKTSRGKKDSTKDTIIDITSDSQVNSNFPNRWSQEGSIQYDPDCGFSKGCFVDCDSDGCKFMVTWQDVGEAVSFELYGKPKYTDSWIAVGFSKDSRMTDDSVTECVHNGGFIQAYNSYNPSYHNDRLENSQVGLTGVSGSYYNGVFSCRFTRAKRVDSEPHIFDLEKDWNIMFAHGKAVPGFRISVHSETPATSAAHVDFQKFIIVGRAARFSLVKAHGCLMILAWVLFTGVGIVLARYYKNVWADKTFLKLKIWFQAHRACMVTALVLDLIAFIIIFVDVKGYSQIPDIPGKTYLRSHPILGIIVTLLCVANPVMALFRPGPGDSKRPIFNWAHWGVGITAYILSALCICFGFQLGKASTPDYAVYIMIGYIIYVVLFDIACEVHDYLTKKEKKGKVESMEMSNHNGTDNGVANGNSTNYSTKEKTKKSDKLKTILLAVHIAFTGAFALVLVLVVALN